MFRNVGI